MTTIHDSAGAGIGKENPLPVQSQASAPVLIQTIPYTSITVAGSTNWLQLNQVLNRNAKQRTFIFVNQLNQPITSIGMYLFDYSIETDTAHLYPQEYSFTANNIDASNGRLYAVSEQNLGLCAHVDSVLVSVGMGATLPTSGNLLVYVVELI